MARADRSGAWLRAEHFTATRGDRRLFEDVAFGLDRGRALLLRGPNGSGKSTLLRSLVGLAVLDSGRISVAGETFDAASRRLCPLALYQGHASGLKGELAATQCLRFAAELDGSPHDEAAIRAALARMGLAAQAEVDVRRLSQGQKQRLTLCRLVLARTRAARDAATGTHDAAVPAPAGATAAANDGDRIRPLWLLDEPSAALDATGAALLDVLLAEHLDAGGAAIVATHLPLPGIAARSDVLAFGAPA